LRNKKCSKLAKANLINKKMLSIDMLKMMLGVIFVFSSALAAATDFRSVAVPKAVLYDAPSKSAGKVFLLNQYYPVEVIVNLGDWLKVRDAEGGVFWIEAKNIASLRTVIVTAETDIHQEAQDSSAVLAHAEKNIMLELLEPTPSGGWLKVKHVHGITGFIRFTSVWGI
jgi:SH3-like domain-containing protein